MVKIHNFLMPYGGMLKFKFGYTDSNGEYYSNYTDASKANNGNGVKYGAFYTTSNDTNPWWVYDDFYCDNVVDRELTSKEMSIILFEYYVYLTKEEYGDDAATELVCKLYKKSIARDVECKIKRRCETP